MRPETRRSIDLEASRRETNASILSTVCRKCRVFDAITGKTVCEACAISVYTESNSVREHKWNMKVNIRVMGYHCLNCDLTYSPVGLPLDLPECKPVVHKAAPTPFIPYIPTKQNGIHPAKYVKPTERKAVSSYVKKVKPVVKPYNPADKLDFFGEI